MIREESNSLTQGFGFGRALELMRHGDRVARKSWKAGTTIRLPELAKVILISMPQNLAPDRNSADEYNRRVEFIWPARSPDLLAADWIIIDT